MSPYCVDVAAQQVLQRGGGEEVLLAQPQLLPGGALVAGIEHLRDRLGARPGRRSAPTWSPRLNASRRSGVGRARRPQAQRVDVLAAPADHRRVVGDRLDRLGRLPGIAAGPSASSLAARRGRRSRSVGDLRPLELPRVAEGQPVLRHSCCQPSSMHLAEQAVLVADAVAVGRRCRGVAMLSMKQAASRPEAAVAERRVRLDCCAAGRDRRPVPRSAARIASVRPRLLERVAQQPADQELQRQVVDALAPSA